MMNVYANKKSSGVYWLGEIPNHWSVTSLKRILSEPLKYGATEAGDCDNRSLPRYLRITDFDSNGSLRSDTFASLPEEIATEYSVNDGDILFARSGATVGKTFLFRNYPGQACFAGYLIKASPARHKVTSEFLYYFTKSPAYDAWKDFIFTQATIQNIGADKYAYLPICLPPIIEQQCIVAYLDTSCKAIDAAVAAKQRQLETLDALRKETITRAITQGLDPSVPMKPSGEHWLGEIPAHWSSLCLKRMLSEPLTYGLNEAAELDDRDLPRYLRITDFDEDGNLRDDTFRSLPREIAREALLKPNDVLFARSGATVGKTFLFRRYDGEACFAGYLIRARTLHWKLDPVFLYLFTKSNAYETWKNLIFTQATIQNISAAKYNYLAIPVPPLDEQRAIIAYVEKKSEEFGSLFECIESQVATLTAYRKSLIHECVTGQRRITAADLERVQAHV